MANQGAKKRLDSNQARLQTLRIWMIVGNVVYILGRFFRGASLKHQLAFLIVNAVFYYCYTTLVKATTAQYDTKGQLVSAGSSLDQAGLLEYLQDVIYLFSILQCTTWISDWIWLLSLAAPLYGGYLLYINFLGPYLKQLATEQQQKNAPSKSSIKKQQRQGKEKRKNIRVQRI